jgi:hypothetical protein
MPDFGGFGSYISSQMPGADIQQIMQRRQGMYNRTPISDLLAQPQESQPGQPEGTVRPRVAIAPGANSPIGDIPMEGADAVSSAAATGGFPVVQNLQASPALGGGPLMNQPAPIGQPGSAPAHQSPIDALAAAAGHGPTSIIGTQDSFNGGRSWNPLQASNALAPASPGAVNNTVLDMLGSARNMLTGGAGSPSGNRFDPQTGGYVAITPGERTAGLAALSDQQRAGISQQAEDRLRTELMGASGTPGSMANQASAAEVNRQRAAFETSERTARARVIDNAIASSAQAGRPMSPQQVEQLRADLERANPIGPAAAPQSNATPPGSVPPGGQPPTQPGAPAYIADVLRNAHTVATSGAGQNAQGQPNAVPAGAAISQIINSLASSGHLNGGNLPAIAQFMNDKFGNQAFQDWQLARDPLIQIGPTSPATQARTAFQRAANIRSTPMNANTGILPRLNPFNWISGPLGGY